MADHVLVIDDCVMTSRLVQAQLQREPFKVTVLHDGAEGLKFAAAQQPDVILLDVQMPGMDGFEVCRRLKEESATSSIPVIFLTGESDTDKKIAGLDLGAQDYITKPFDTAELLARVRVALRTKLLVDLLAERAQVDALTGLWNRAYFDDQIRRSMRGVSRRGEQLGLILGDIDHFKQCNDRHGHLFGDRVLQAIGALYQDVCRADETPCRYGGEEFAFILPGVTIEQTEQFAERIRLEIEKLQLEHNGEVVPIRSSFGAAVCAVDPGIRVDGQVRDLIETADQNLYRAKEAGRNRVIAGLVQQAAA